MATAKSPKKDYDSHPSKEEEMAVELASLRKVRKYMRAKVTRIYQQLTANLGSIPVRKLKDYGDQLSSLKLELIDIGMKITAVLPEDTDFSEEMEQEEEYSDRITLALEVLAPHIVDPNVNVNMNNQIPIVNPVQNKLKLPTIELPVFSNDKTDNLEKFFYAFESIVDKHNLSHYEKFVYLRSQVRKGPEALLNSLDPNHQTYDNAKKLLVDAFASPLTQKYDAIKKLSELKLNQSDDVYKFIGSMRSIMSSFDNLAVDVPTVVQYFIWNSMNKRFQDQLIQITNVTKPSLDQIKTHIFSAAERYLKLGEVRDECNYRKNAFNEYNNKSYKPDNPITNALAVNVHTKACRPCNLCVADKVKNIEHELRNCPVYKTAADKVKKLKALKYCSRCTFTNHDSFNCKFKFHSPCRFCKKPHMSFLCLHPNMESLNASVSCVHFNNIVRNDSTILPTFSLAVNNDCGVTTCRTLYDTGSQCNFIAEGVANLLDLEVIERDIDLQINGFPNTKKKIVTWMVKVPFVVKDTTRYIGAIVVPEITIRIHCNNLPEITSSFLDKGYLLADTALGDSEVVSDFDLVMGPDAVLLLCPQTVIFGSVPDHSAFFETERGILLLGKTSEIIKNLAYLPSLTHKNCTTGKNVQPIKNELLKLPNNSNCIHKGSDTVSVNTSTVSDVLNESGDIDKHKLLRATDEALEACSGAFLHYDEAENSDCSEVNKKIIDYVLSNTDRTPEGRLIMPLPWNPNCKHLLGQNYNLSRKILSSNYQKLVKHNQLAMYDEVFREQERLGMVERIEDVEAYMKANPDCSFLPHMAVIRMAKETTKLRVVLLSNLCERNKNQPYAVSHNNALLPGPCLNSKISISLLLSRFNKYILAFDIQKAFLGIELRESDQNKLLCLWYRSVERKDFSLVAFKNLRLSFGLRPSPAILMIALYKICILDIENDGPDVVALKRQIYHGIYMDNGLVGCNDKETIRKYFVMLPLIFDEYMFALQQFATNCLELQCEIDNQFDKVTDVNLKYFGMNWDRDTDSLGPFPIQMDVNACTKRSILSSLNSVYDLFGACLPLINRAKLYFHNLQCDKTLGWDTKLDQGLLKEWQLISKQCNSAPALKINRFIGSRDSEYSLVAFSDSSAAIYGVVIYIIDNKTNKVSFLIAKNRVVNTSTSKKTIPALECQGVVLAAETMINLYVDLSTDNSVCPVNITDLFVYTDSMVCLSWLKGYFIDHEKMQRRSVYVMNRLKELSELCKIKPITFRFIEGRENPGDCVTRPFSYKALSKTSYLNGPRFLYNLPEQPEFEVVVPNPICALSADDTSDQPQAACLPAAVTNFRRPLALDEHLVDPTRVSTYLKLVTTYCYVFRFIRNLKRKVSTRINFVSDEKPVENCRTYANNILMRTEQKIYFPELVKYFETSKIGANYKIPNLVLQLNLFSDEQSIIRVKGKLTNCTYPILLNNNSRIAELIITQLHVTYAHSGVYTVLRELRRQFWILRGFSTVRRLLRHCVTCKKVNESPLKLSQNSYRDFRSSPSKIPFNYVFMDYIGPINVRFGKEVRKTWLLIITCLYTRAISLMICFTADTPEFLRCLQMHVYKYGMFSLCISDLGTQLKAGANIISNFLDDLECKEYFECNGIYKLTFEQYAKGNSSLGSLVEVLVKQTKNLIVKSIGKLILPYPDFQLLIAKVNHIINRRPLTFRETLRETTAIEDLLEPITPEQLLHGRELPSVNIVPSLQPECDEYRASPPSYKDDYQRIRAALAKLNDVYHSEFLTTLLVQSIDQKDRFKPVRHKTLSPGDVVLLVEPQTKRTNYPMAIVKKVNVNSLGEITSAVVMKGKNREEVFRHSSTIIPLFTPETNCEEDNGDAQAEDNPAGAVPTPNRPPRRLAALKADEKFVSQLND